MDRSWARRRDPIKLFRFFLILSHYLLQGSKRELYIKSLHVSVISMLQKLLHKCKIKKATITTRFAYFSQTSMCPWSKKNFIIEFQSLLYIEHLFEHNLYHKQILERGLFWMWTKRKLPAVKHLTSPYMRTQVENIPPLLLPSFVLKQQLFYDESAWFLYQMSSEAIVWEQMVPSMTGTQVLFQPSSMLGEPNTVSPGRKSTI